MRKVRITPSSEGHSSKEAECAPVGVRLTKGLVGEPEPKTARLVPIALNEALVLSRLGSSVVGLGVIVTLSPEKIISDQGKIHGDKIKTVNSK